MDIEKKLILEFRNYAVRSSLLFHKVNEELKIRYSRKQKLHGRLLLPIAQYLQHASKFHRSFVYVTDKAPIKFYNSNFGGTVAKVNNSKVDISISFYIMLKLQ